jgi:signal transduction histidine kinase
MKRIRARLPDSLRWRLTAWVAVALLLSIGVLLAVVYENTGSQLRGQIDRDIAGDVSQASQALSLMPGQTPHQITQAATRYVKAQPYTAAARLLFVLVPGAGATSNHPEVFSVTGREPGEPLTQQEVENGQAKALSVPHLGYSVQQFPDVGRMRILERRVRVGQLLVIVGAGEPLNMVERAQHGVARAVLIAGAVTVAIVLLISWLAAARVSAPLRRLAGVAARVDAGDLAPRMPEGAAQTREVAVLAEAFNHMLDRLAHAFASQREFVADASHELRTPLTVIRGQLEVLAAQEHPSPAEIRRVEALVEAEIGRMSRLVEDLLVLAQAERTDFLRTQGIELEPFVTELWDGLSLTAGRRFELGSVPRGILRGDPDRLAQALRNLAGNAIEHTQPDTGLVRLEVQALGDGRIRFAVVDDGPGIPQDQRQRVFGRFYRLEPGRSGTSAGAGLGLAIVRAIATAHGGQVQAVDPQSGRGARIELVLPGFSADRTAVAVPEPA